MSYSSKNRSLSLKKTVEDKNTAPKSPKTPVQNKNSVFDDDFSSPIEIRCTQDGGDDELDVIWDWSSPQSRVQVPYRRKRQKKRPLKNISPQIPRKLQMKNNLIPTFSSLKAELEKISNFDEIKDTENNFEDLGVQFNDTDFEGENLNKDSMKFETQLGDFMKNTKDPTTSVTSRLDVSDPFGDDSFDDDLVRCSQQVEQQFLKPQPKAIELLINSPKIADDSFDAMIEDYTDEDLVRLSQDSPEATKTPIKSRTIYRTHSTPVRPSPSTSKSDFVRTKSAEHHKISPPSPSLITCSPEEIEKKRMEAKARLELRKQLDRGKTTFDEIEQKRLEAKARLVSKHTNIERHTETKSILKLNTEKYQAQNIEISNLGTQEIEITNRVNQVTKKFDFKMKSKPTEEDTDMEYNRLEAKRKLELKTQQEIERKRLEALERLKRNKALRSGLNKR